MNRLNSSFRFLFTAIFLAAFLLAGNGDAAAQKKARKKIGGRAAAAKKPALKTTTSPIKQNRVQNQDGPWEGETGVTRTTAQLQLEYARSPKNRMIENKFGERDHIQPDRKNLPQNPESLPLAKFPDDPMTQPIRQNAEPDAPALTPQTVQLDFNGATLFDSLSFPPDTMGDIGPSQYIVAVNGWLRSFNKNTGGADGVLNLNIDTFFNSVRNGATTTDPRIRYDRLSQRWFVAIINDVDFNNRVLIAVSNSATITAQTTWTFYFFQINTVTPEGDNGCFADYPTLGIDVHALYIGVNNFCPNSFAGSSAYVVRKSSLLNGGSIVATAFRGLVPSGQADGPYTPQGVDNFDPAATEGYFIGVSNAAFGRLILRRVSDPGGNPTISGNINISVPTTDYAPSIPHLGNNGGNGGNLDSLDDRLFSAVLRNGRLYTAHNIGVNANGVANPQIGGDRAASRWYEFENLSTTPTLRQSGTWFDNSATPKNFWIPSIMVSGQGHVALGGSSAGANDRVNAATIGRLANDALGTLQSTLIYTNTSASYNPPGNPGGGGGRRWGDYSYTSIDPEDDMTMWTIQQWNHASNSYAVRVAKLLAPPPATPTGAEPSSLSSGQSSVNVTINGISTNGSGFFDPGAGFPKRLQVVISGGVTVNSVTYNSPTQITVNVSTVGATSGAKTVTVINPDGQQISAPNLINISGTQLAGIKPQVDFDGDGKTDISVFRNSNGTGFWYYIRSNDNAFQAVQWGNGTDLPTPADFDGDNKTDTAVFRPSNSTWYVLKSSNNSFAATQWGTGGDKPAPGDFDGDNKADIAVFRPSAGTWFVLRSSDNGFTAQSWGTSGDIPVFGRYDGDTKDDFAVFRPSNSTWYVQLSSDNSIRALQWGTGGDVPVPGDYDNDGRFDFAVFRPSNGNWYASNSSNGAMTSAQWGQNGDVPTPGDFDGDRKNDFAVFRPSNGTWYVLRSTNGSILGSNFGLSGDKPLPSAYTN